MNATHPVYDLGIDIGTSKVAAVLWDAAAGRLVAAHSMEHRAAVAGLPAGRAEQDVARIWAAVRTAMARFSAADRAAVRRIGVTGQMHGVVVVDQQLAPVTNLVTWQDQRCLEDGFLAEFRDRTGDASVHTGFGGATLAWLAGHDAIPAGAAAGSITRQPTRRTPRVGGFMIWASRVGAHRRGARRVCRPSFCRESCPAGPARDALGWLLPPSLACRQMCP